MDDEPLEQDYQRDYFESLIRKYECRNTQFTQRQCDLRQRLEAIERSLPAIMCFNMMQPKNDNRPTAIDLDSSPVKEESAKNEQKERQVFKNVRDDKNMRSCNCNICPLDPDYETKSKSGNISTRSINIRADMNMRNCSCTSCPIDKDIPFATEGNVVESKIVAKTDKIDVPSNNTPYKSIISTDDTRYLTRIKELAKNEQKLKEDIEELEHREQAYSEVMKQPTEWSAKDIGCTGAGDFEMDALKHMNQELEDNNKMLADELKEVKNEIKHIQETIEEPMRRELETEKCKCLNLEEKIHKRAADMTVKQSAQQRQMNLLQRQVQSANQNLSDLHIVNKRLKEELCMLNCRCNELQTDLINQKISEVHTISRLTASHHKETYEPPFIKSTFSANGGDTDGDGSSDDLNNIARNLSKLIQDATSCKNCKHTHNDMIDTVQYIKNLVDIVNSDKRDLPTTKSTSDTFCKCVNWEKLREEMHIEEPTYEILSPKRAYPKESVPSTVVDRSPTTSTVAKIAPGEERAEQHVEQRAEQKVEQRAEQTVKQPRRESAVETAEHITDMVLQRIVSETPDLKQAPAQLIAEPEIKTSVNVLEEPESYKEVDHEDISQTEIGLVSEAITDATVSTSPIEQLITESSEPPASVTVEEDADVTTDVDEEENILESDEEREVTAEPKEQLSQEKQITENAEFAEETKQSEADVVETMQSDEERDKVQDTEDTKAAESAEVPTDDSKDKISAADDVTKNLPESEMEKITVADMVSEPKEYIATEEVLKVDEDVPIGVSKDEDDITENLAASEMRNITGTSTVSDAKEEIPAEELPKVNEEPTVEDELKPEGDSKIYEDVNTSEQKLTFEEVVDVPKIYPIEDTEKQYETPSSATEIISTEEEVKQQLTTTPKVQQTESVPTEWEEIAVQEQEAIEAIPELEAEQEEAMVTQSQEIPPPEQEAAQIDKSAVEQQEFGPTEINQMPAQEQEIAEKIHESTYKEDEKGDIESLKPDEKSTLAADIIRTICRCIPKEQPTLCDCLEKKEEPTKVSSSTSRDLHIKKILHDVVNDLQEPKETLPKEGYIDEHDKIGSAQSSKKSLVIEQIGEKISPTKQKSISKESSRKSLPPEGVDKKLSPTEQRVSSKESSRKSVHSKESSKKSLQPEEIGQNVVSKEHILSSKESSKKSLHSKEISKQSLPPGENDEKATLTQQKLDSKESSKKSVQSKQSSKKSLPQYSDIAAIASPKASEPASRTSSQKLVDLDQPKKKSLSTVEIDLDIKQPGSKEDKLASKEQSKASFEEAVSSPTASKKPLQQILSTSKVTSKTSLPLEQPQKTPLEKSKTSLEDHRSASLIHTEIIPSKPESQAGISKPPSETKCEGISKSASKESKEKLITKEESRKSIKVKSNESFKQSKEILSKPASKEMSIKSLPDKLPSIKEDISAEGATTDRVVADIETEGNVPIEAEIELISKSSDGVYITTTVTSSGHVEVTTEGPTGVVETTLKVTESGNLEVVTGVTEFDKPSEGDVKEIESDSKIETPQLEVIHPPIDEIKESQDTLDIEEPTKSSDQVYEESKGSVTSVTQTEITKELDEETKTSSDAPLGVIKEEEEDMDKKDQKPVQEIIPQKTCECPPPDSVCKCKIESIIKQDDIDNPSEKIQYPEDIEDHNKDVQDLDDENQKEKLGKQEEIDDQKEEIQSQHDSEDQQKEITHEEVIAGQEEKTSSQTDFEDQQGDHANITLCKCKEGDMESETSKDDMENESSEEDTGNETPEGEETPKTVILCKCHSSEIQSENNGNQGKEDKKQDENEYKKKDHRQDTKDDQKIGTRLHTDDLKKESEDFKVIKKENEESTDEIQVNSEEKVASEEKTSIGINEAKRSTSSQENIEPIRSVEIVAEVPRAHTCHEYVHNGSSGSSVSDISIFEDLEPDDMKLEAIRETSTTTIESSRIKSLVIESTIEYKTHEQLPHVYKPPEQIKEEKTSKSILKYSGSNWSSEQPEVGLRSNESLRRVKLEHPSIKQSEAIAAETSTTDLNFSTCVCEQKTLPNKSETADTREASTQQRSSQDDDRFSTPPGPGPTTVNNLKIIICNRDSCKTYPMEKESTDSIPTLPKCTCVKSTQRQIPKVCNIKSCTADNMNQEENNRLKTKFTDEKLVQEPASKKKMSKRSSDNKLVLENATCTTCDKSSCQVIKSGSRYTSMDSISYDEDLYICPDTCRSVGVQHPPKKTKTEFACPKSCDDMRIREKITSFKEKTIKSFSKDVCADDQSTAPQNKSVYTPDFTSKGTQPSISIQRKSHSTNTPRSSKMCNVDLCDSARSTQRTVSTYYSCNPVGAAPLKKASPPQLQKVVCDSNACKNKSKGTTDPRVSITDPRICDRRTCKKDIAISYESPRSRSQNKTMDKTCTCKKELVSSIPKIKKSDSIPKTASTSLTCSGVQVDLVTKPVTQTSNQCPSTTCSAAKYFTPTSSTSKHSGKTSEITCASPTCVGKIVEQPGLPMTPKSSESESENVSSHSSTRSKSISDIVSCPSPTCSGKVTHSRDNILGSAKVSTEIAEATSAAADSHDQKAADQLSDKSSDIVDKNKIETYDTALESQRSKSSKIKFSNVKEEYTDSKLPSERDIQSSNRISDAIEEKLSDVETKISTSSPEVRSIVSNEEKQLEETSTDITKDSSSKLQPHDENDGRDISLVRHSDEDDMLQDKDEILKQKSSEMKELSVRTSESATKEPSVIRGPSTIKGGSVSRIPSAMKQPSITKERSVTKQLSISEQPSIMDAPIMTIQSSRTEKEPSITKEQNITKQLTISKEPSVTEEQIMTNEPSITSGASLTKEPSVTRDPNVKKEPSVTRHPSVTKEPSETKDPSVTKEPSVTRDPSVTKEPSVTRDPSVTKEPSVRRDPSVTKKSSVTRDPRVTKEPSETKDPSVTKEPSVTRDPSVTKEPSVRRDPSVTKKSSVTRDPRVTKEPSETKDPSVTKEPSVTRDPSITKKASVTRYPSVTKEPSVTRDPSVMGEPRVVLKPSIMKKPSTPQNSKDEIQKYAVAAQNLSSTEKQASYSSDKDITTMKKSKSDSSDQQRQHIEQKHPETIETTYSEDKVLRSDSPKIPKLSSGNLIKPKSASRYTLTEKETSVIDYNKEERVGVNAEQRIIYQSRDEIIVERTDKTKSISEKSSTSHKSASNSSKNVIVIQEGKDETPEKDEENKISEQSSGSMKESEQQDQSQMKESGEIPQKDSKTSKASGSTSKSTGEKISTEISAKIKSNEKQIHSPRKGADKEGSKPSSKESICLPCGRIHERASGDKMGKPKKEPPDKESKISITTGSEKKSKSKIPVLVTKTSSVLKEKHQGDCACVECLTEETQKGGHPPDCNCVDCLCHPKKFEQTLPTLPEPEHSKEPDLQLHSPSCTCIDCLCNPTVTPRKPSTDQKPHKKAKHSSSCDCIDCLCSPTIADKQSITQITPTVVCPAIEPVKSKHHPACKCPVCSCDPCGHQPDCSCVLCKCDPCKDVIREFKKHPPDCTCPDCICAPCGDKSVEEKKHSRYCSCPDCTCNPCCVKKVEEQKHPEDCTCPDCICVPCFDKKIEESKHSHDCNCADCICDPCTDVKVQNKKEHPKDCDCPEGSPPPSNNEEDKEVKLPQTHIEDGDCTCQECICDPCDDPKVASKKAKCQKCGCIVCVCAPCEDPKIITDRTPHPPSCNCPKCFCDPCQDLTKVQAHGPDCRCKRCICSPCKPDIKHGPNCDCPTCSCDPCTDLQPKTSVHGPDCTCKKCICSTKELTHGPTCDCTICSLNPEKKPSIHGLDCTCEKCKKVIVKEPQHSKNCRCSICKRSDQQKPKPISDSKKHSKKCKCSTCQHHKIKTDTKAMQENARSSTREVDLPEIPEECPNCDCSPICICDDCPAKKNNTAPVAKNMKNETLKKSIKNIEQENIQRERDIKELEGLMDQIRCACKDAEEQASRTTPPEPTYIQKASSFKNTLSGLEIAMNTLQEKCKVKDKMIDAMTQELRLRANSNIFQEMLKNIAGSPSTNVDFDRNEICDSLPRPLNDPKYGKTSHRYVEDTSVCVCKQGAVNMKIINVKPISPNSILIKWTQPENSEVIGYEVVINNVLKSRIRSVQRTTAVVFAVDVKNKINISIFAITQLGRCQPPATCTYG